MIVRFSEACILHATLKAAEMAIAPSRQNRYCDSQTVSPDNISPVMSFISLKSTDASASSGTPLPS